MIRSASGLPAALEAINRKYGPGTVQTATEFLCWGGGYRYVMSGIDSLTMAIGAIPLGRVIEIHGDEGSGKTALALHLVRCIGGPVLYLDADCGLSPLYLREFPEMFVMHPETLEDALEIVRTAAEGFQVIVIDTLSALPSRADLSFRLDESCLSDDRTAKILSHALPVLVQIMQRTGCTLILVNQMRNNPNILIGRTEYPTGGRAVGYYTALRMETYRVEKNNVGQRVRIFVRKNKYGAPHRYADVGLIYGYGVTSASAWKIASADGYRGEEA